MAQKNRNFAAALALFCPLPLRGEDSRLRFGDHIGWNGTAYDFFLPGTSKNGVPLRSPILPFFALFLDQLILQGQPAEWLDKMRERCIRQRRPLFVNQFGEPHHPRYISRVWWEVFGTGSHAARTKLHDASAVFGVAGIEAALRACAQRSPGTARFYRSEDFTLKAGDHVHRAFKNDITPVEWDEYFKTD